MAVINDKCLFSLSVLVIIQLLLFYCDILSAFSSGFYLTSHTKQTVLHRKLTTGDTEQVEHQILDLLGLPDRPRKEGTNLSVKKSAPKFLLDIYKQLLEEDDDEHRGRTKRSTEENMITDLDQRVIPDSNEIMTFLNKKNMVSQIRHENGYRLWFDLTEVTAESSLIFAVLRLHRSSTSESWPSYTKEFVITASLVGETEMELISSINVTYDKNGWLELNVTDAVHKWTVDGYRNLGFHIEAFNIHRQEQKLKFARIGLDSMRGDDEEYQPFMVGYFKGPDIIRPKKTSSRQKRSAANRKSKKSPKRNPFLDIQPLEGCHRRNLYVSFKDLRWHDWIIAPDGFSAFYCSGDCTFPLNAHMNATNHAIIQTLVHLRDPNEVPQPCCSPMKLSPISVLYFLDETNVNLKKYKNMVVKSCGCH